MTSASRLGIGDMQLSTLVRNAELCSASPMTVTADNLEATVNDRPGDANGLIAARGLLVGIFLSAGLWVVLFALVFRYFTK